MKKRHQLVYIAMIVASIIVILLSILSLFNIEVIPGLVPLFILIVMLCLGVVMKMQFDIGKISKAHWRIFLLVIVIGIIANVIAGLAQVIDYLNG